MAPTRVTVEFLGLIGLVPPAAPEEFWLAVFPNLRSGAAKGEKGLPTAIPSHHALLAVRSEDIEGVPGKKPKFRAVLEGPTLGGTLPVGQELTFFEIDDEVVSLDCGDEGIVTEADVPNGYGTAAATPMNEASLCWVPPLQKVSTVQAKFDRGLLQEDTEGRQAKPINGRLAGTFAIDRGRLRSAGVLKGGAHESLYEFRSADGMKSSGWSQSLARGFSLQLDHGDEVSTLLFDGAHQRYVELRAPDARIWVIHREAEELLGLTLLHETASPGAKAGEGDVDFAIFFTLTEKWTNETALIAIPFLSTKEVLGKNKPCGSAQYAE